MTTTTRTVSFALTAALLLGSVRPAAAVRIEANEDVFLDVHYLVQPWVQLSRDPLASPEASHEFYIRRSRLILMGQVSPFVKFFMETDQPNWGKEGDWTPDMMVQDAFVAFEIHDAFKVDLGMLLVPFIHHAHQGAVNLHTLDYHAALVRYPAGSSFVWRDNGVAFRGALLKDHFTYRVAITNGVPAGDSDIPRFSGRLEFNAFDAEAGFFHGGTYLGKKKILSVGGAFDVEPDAFGDGSHYYAFGGDLFMDIPLGDNRLSGQLAYVYYGGADHPGAGMGALFDLGYAFGKLEPIVVLDWFAPRGASSASDHMLGGHVGLNWWLHGHNANIKLQLGMVHEPGEEGAEISQVVTVQTQLFI